MADHQNGTPSEKLSRKERKRRKKLVRAEQLALEKKLVDEGKIPVRNRYIARGFFWRVFSLCLAFVLGLFAAVGGFLGFAAFAPVKDVLWLTGIDYKNVLEEDYAKQSILDVAKGIAKDSFSSLGDIAKYTPILDKYLGQLNTSLLDLGAHVDLEKLKATKFDALGAYFRDEVLDTIVLGETLDIGPDADGLMLGLCYGTEGEDYTVQDGKIVMNEGKKALTIGDLSSGSALIEKITVESALGISASSPAAMRYLAYGTEGVHYEIRDGAVVMLENEITGETFRKKTISDLTSGSDELIENAKISDLVAIDGEKGILTAIKDWKISDLQETYRIERIRLDQILDLEGSTSALSKAISGWRIGDLLEADKMDSLTLADVMTIADDAPLILRTLADTPIGEFSAAVDGLRLADILEEKDFEGNNFLRTLRMSSLTTLSSDLQNLSAADVFGEELYSYLDPTEFGGKHYAQLVEEYETTGRNTKDALVPKALELGKNAVTEYYLHGSDSARLTGGYVYGDGSGYTVVPAKDVHTRMTDGEKQFYTEGEQRLEAHVEWQKVDYEAGALVPLPEGDEVSADLKGHTLVPRSGGTPYTDGSEAPLYYLTTRTAGEETEQVAYPLFADDYGVYFTRLVFVPDEEKGGSYRDERVDLEYTVSSYSYEKDGTVTIEKGEDGWTSGGVPVSVYEKKGEDGYAYIKTETPVLYRYFEAPAESTAVSAVYEEADVTRCFEAKKGDGTTVSVDRYLSGVWFFLFGTDEDEDGNLVVRDESGNFIDNTHVPVLELTSKMPTMTTSISDTVLWRLYLHGLVNKDPYVALTGTPFEGKITLSGHDAPIANLNECTVVECISLVDQIIHINLI